MPSKIQAGTASLELVNFRSSRDPQGNSPLHFACKGGYADIAELLIRKMGAVIDLKNAAG